MSLLKNIDVKHKNNPDEIIKILTNRSSIFSDMIKIHEEGLSNPIKHKVDKILLIDDDPILNFLVGKILQKVFPHVDLQYFSEANEALTHLTQMGTNVPQIILVDINMPDLNGWETLDFLKKLNLTSKIVMFTSSIDPSDIEKADQYDIIWDYVIKPIDEEKLRKLIQRAENE